MTYEDDLALLAEDIKRYAGADARIHEAVEQWLKLHSAEVDALAFEVRELEKSITQLTTQQENGRIREARRRQTESWNQPRTH